MRYFVTTANGEQGPYEESDIRGWLRTNTMPLDAPVRREDATESVPARVAFPEDVPAPPRRPVPTAYAPMDVEPEDGNFWQGFAFGFFCGCIALIASFATKMGSETKRGVRTGFAVGFVLGIVVRILRAAARH